MTVNHTQSLSSQLGGQLTDRSLPTPGFAHQQQWLGMGQARVHQCEEPLHRSRPGDVGRCDDVSRGADDVSGGEGVSEESGELRGGTPRINDVFVHVPLAVLGENLGTNP